MGLFRTSLLVVLSCAVMSVRAANFNQPKAVASTDVEPFFNVSINEPTKLIQKYVLVDTYSKEARTMEIEADSGNIVWQWPIPKNLKAQKKICHGATVQYMSDDSFNVLVPHKGVINVKRSGKNKMIVKDKEIDHAAHQYDDKNMVFVRGFVNKNDHSITQTQFTSSFNSKEFKWKPVDTFPTKEGFTVKQERSCGAPMRWAKEREQDWAHANYVEKLSNGNLLISLRNFSTFLELNPETSEVVYKNNTIPGVHQPTPYEGGYLAADRACGKESIHWIKSDGTHLKLFTGEFLTTRGIEHLAGNHFLITSATNITEISLDGKIHYRATIPKANPVHEKSVTSQGDLPPWGFCAPTVLYHAVPTSVRNK